MRKWMFGLLTSPLAAACGAADSPPSGTSADTDLAAEVSSADDAGPGDAIAPADLVAGDDSASPADALEEDGSPQDGAATDPCPASHFVQGAAHPGNAAYPAPALSATCTDAELVVTSNGIIDYAFVPMTPNDLAAQDYTWRIPLTPTWLDTPADIPLLGPVGVAVNGVPIYGPNEGAFPDPYGDPVYNSIVDDCLGHTAQRGDYHYHALLVSCLVRGASASEPDPIIGFSFDGFPIHGPRGCLDAACTELVTFRSGWQQTGDPATYAWDNNAFTASADPTVLDRCNGRIGPDGTYRYHATETFPYVLGCYHGVATAQGGATVDPGGGADPGGACATDDDCAGDCPAGSLACGCRVNREGARVCVPTCRTTADCPAGLTCGGREGDVCVPSGGPPPP